VKVSTIFSVYEAAYELNRSQRDSAFKAISGNHVADDLAVGEIE
jgi:hypothetical protein